MIEKFNKILESMNAKGMIPVVLFAILKMDDLEDKWTVIYADDSSVLDESGKNLIFTKLLNEIKKEFTNSDLEQIARIAIFQTSDYLIQALLDYKTGQKISNKKVNGNFIHEGYIIWRIGENFSQEKELDIDESGEKSNS